MTRHVAMRSRAGGDQLEQGGERWPTLSGGVRVGGGLATAGRTATSDPRPSLAATTRRHGWRPSRPRGCAAIGSTRRRRAWTFRDWAPQWLSESVHLKPSTIASYESILECHLLPRWGNVALGRIERPAVRSWVTKLSAEGMGAGTLKNVVNTFKAALSAAVEAGLIIVSPAARVRLPHPVRAEKTFLTAEEVGRLAAAAPTEYRTLILFAAYSGLRAGEIAALRWERVDLRGRRSRSWSPTPRFTASSCSARPRPTAAAWCDSPASSCELLGEHQALTGPTGLVFRDSHGGPHRHSNFYRRIFQPAVGRRPRGRDPEGSALPRPTAHVRRRCSSPRGAPNGDQGTARP